MALYDETPQGVERWRELPSDNQRSNWIRLRTTILLRWVAICGQISAVVGAQIFYQLQLPIGLCTFAIGVSIIGNWIAHRVYPENTRLREHENLFMVMFDLCQLSFLLFATGGLNNPFAILVIGPVIVSATVLHLSSALIVGGMTFLIISVLAFVHLPLRTQGGDILALPGIFIFGEWLAITIALAFTSLYTRRVTREMHSMSDALTATQMALARTQKLNDLGGVVAAAAHELGTPLATIKLTSSELIDDLEGRPELQEDVRLIREQTDRCRDILRSMGQAGKDDKHMHNAPVEAVLIEAAEPHQGRGKEIVITLTPKCGGIETQPHIIRKPELIHGLRNLVQNAVDFADSTVWIEASWTDAEITIRIIDNGPGFPPHLIGRIGDPFVGGRQQDANNSDRGEYEGMGLGLFIAKTLLERSGAQLSFANGETNGASETPSQARQKGAIIEVGWPLAQIVSAERDVRKALGENLNIE